MTDPCRWDEEGGDATDLERDLIRAGRGAGPSPEEQKQIWLGIAGLCIPPAAGAGTGAAVAAAAKGGGVLTVGKVVAVAALVGGGAFTGHHLVRRQPPAGPQVQTVNTPAVVPAERASAMAEPGAPIASPPRVSPTAARVAAPAADDAKKLRASRLAEESRMVLEARNLLRSGDPGGALRLLDGARTAFPDGALTQEREALSIEAIARSGQRDLASRRAEAFLRDYPKSPHASDVKRYVVIP
jgi:hypothetical protein